MTNFTVIRQRDSYTDTCRGCIMDQTDNLFEMTLTDNEVQATILAANWLAEGQAECHPELNSDYRSYVSTEVIVLVNGYGLPGYYDNDIVTPSEYEKILNRVIGEARRLSTQIINDKVLMARKLKEEKERFENSIKESTERKMLAKLQAKYQGTP